MEIYNQRICLEYGELVGVVMSNPNYKKLSREGKIDVVRRGCIGNSALVAWDTLPIRFKKRVVDEYGHPEKLMTKKLAEYVEDTEARRFYTCFKMNGSYLPDEEIERCTVNASVLIQIDKIMKRRRAERKMRGNKVGNLWESIIGEYEALRDECGHTLPATLGGLKNKMSAFRRDGFAALVNKRYGNSNSVKITKEGGSYLVALRRSVAPAYNTTDMLDMYNKMAAKKGWKKLQSEVAITSYLAQPEIQQLWWSGVYGEHSAKQKFDRRLKTVLPTKRNALWYGDGTKLNLYYKKYVDGKGWTLATTEVYEVVDAATEMLMGYCITEKENSQAQYNAFRMAIEFAKEQPYEIAVDNQSGYKKIEQFYRGICRVFHTTQPRNPQSKTIEQIFGRFQKQIMAKEFNYTGQNITAKSGGKINLDIIGANIDALPTYDELCTQYAQLRQKWNEGIHPAVGKPRYEYYEEAVNDGISVLTPELYVSMFYVENPKEVTFTTSGVTIQVDGKKYTYEPLINGMPDDQFRAKYTGAKFIVKYDPQDMTIVKLYKKNSKGELVFVSDAYPYITVSRARQDSQEGELSFINTQLKQRDEQRIEREMKGHKISAKWGEAPEDKGYVSPGFTGMSIAKQERIMSNIADQENKRISNLTIDQIEKLHIPKVSLQQLANKI